MQRVASRPRLAFYLFKNLYKSVLFTTWEFKTGEQHLSPCCWLEKMKSSGKALDWLHLWCLFVVSHLAGSVDHCTILLALMARGSASPVFPVSCTGRAPSLCVCPCSPPRVALSFQQPEPCMLSQHSGLQCGQPGEEGALHAAPTEMKDAEG